MTHPDDSTLQGMLMIFQVGRSGVKRNLPVSADIHTPGDMSLICPVNKNNFFNDEAV